METRVYYNCIDKSSWGLGPWCVEPDKIQWQDEDTGFACLIVRNSSLGNLCGYVGVPPEHPAHGKDESDFAFDVHGGITFGGGCQKNADENRGIGHVPSPGEPDNVWWLGFDCAHYYDVVPGLAVNESRYFNQEKYRTVDYVQAECVKLARQLFTLRQETVLISDLNL